MVPKAFKEVKQQVDIVGKGRGDHGDSSWKGFAVFSRRTCHYRLCQVIYAHPSVICVSLQDCTVPTTPPKVTLKPVLIFSPKREPVIVTSVPAGPLVGLILLIDGASR